MGENIKIVFVGHVDHGKSTLIGRLLYDTNSLQKEVIEEIEKTCKLLGKKLEFAYVTDALREEREENITIDTTQIFFKYKDKNFVIIDVPGHKEFFKNMVTGASYADKAILIVDAEEGIKEQTKRHAYALKFLGFDEIIVVINKMDKVNYSKEVFEKLKEEILNYLEKLNIKAKKVIPISAYYGDNVVNKTENLSWYEGESLIDSLDLTRGNKEKFDFRLAIQDVYNLEGNKVAVGNILSGEVEEGEEVFVYPEKEKAKVKKLLTFGEEIKKARKPKALGLVFDKALELERGKVIAKGREPVVADKVKTSVLCLLDKIEENKNYKIFCSTQETNAKIEKIIEKIDIETFEKNEGDILKEGEAGKVILKLEKPLVIEKFKDMAELGRFVIKDDERIIGGGIVL